MLNIRIETSILCCYNMDRYEFTFIVFDVAE